MAPAQSCIEIIKRSALGLSLDEQLHAPYARRDPRRKLWRRGKVSAPLETGRSPSGDAPRATLYRYALEADTLVNMSAILPCMSWKCPTGSPNCLRSCTYGMAYCGRRRKELSAPLAHAGKRTAKKRTHVERRLHEAERATTEDDAFEVETGHEDRRTAVQLAEDVARRDEAVFKDKLEGRDKAVSPPLA